MEPRGDDEAALERARELDAEEVDERALRHYSEHAPALAATHEVPPAATAEDRRRP
jgi:hypothetical protein